MVRNYGKKPKIQCDDKEMQHSLQLIVMLLQLDINTGLDINIVEI